MKKLIEILVFILFSTPFLSQSQTSSWICKNARVSFFSSAPLEDIEATSEYGASAMNTVTGDIVFKLKNSSFQFDKKLMQEHFNENYMESDKYPISEFKGKINNVNELNKQGKYDLIVSGTLDIHGVSKKYDAKVEFVVQEGMITAKTNIQVRLEDHNIKIPSIVGKKIAEIVKVSLSAVYKQ